MAIVWIEPRRKKTKFPLLSFLIVSMVFFLIPICLDISVLISNYLQSKITMEIVKIGFWVPFGLLLIMAIYYPTKRMEILLYFLLTYVSKSLMVIYLNGIRTAVPGFEGDGFYFFYSTWFVFALVGVLYYPVKFGFDASIREESLRSEEKGYLSNNPYIATLQFNGDLPLTKPKGFLLTIYISLIFLSIFVNQVTKWQQ